jgi:hypothetical protein
VDRVTANWQARAACAGTDPDMWDPADRKESDACKAICSRCPVREACLEDALRAEGGASDSYRTGVRGGKSPDERYAIYRARTAKPKPDPATRKHGTIRTYQAGCRCDACKTARVGHDQNLRSTRKGQPIPDTVRHGTLNAYRNWGCRCDTCREANRARRAAERARARTAVAA